MLGDGAVVPTEWPAPFDDELIPCRVSPASCRLFPSSPPPPFVFASSPRARSRCSTFLLSLSSSPPGPPPSLPGDCCRETHLLLLDWLSIPGTSATISGTAGFSAIGVRGGGVVVVVVVGSGNDGGGVLGEGIGETEEGVGMVVERKERGGEGEEGGGGELVAGSSS